MGLFRSSINTRDGTQPENNEVKRVCYSPDGRKLAAACSSGNILVYNSYSSVLETTLSGHSQCVFDVAWGTMANGRTMLTSASHDHTSLVWLERDARAVDGDSETARQGK